MIDSPYTSFLTSDVQKGMSIQEALVAFKLRAWFRVAVVTFKNFDGMKYRINRTYEELSSDLSYLLSAEAIRKIIKKLKDRKFIEIITDKTNGNYYCLVNQQEAIILMDCSLNHMKNLLEVEIPKNQLDFDASRPENSPVGPENSPVGAENSPVVSLYLNRSINSNTYIKDEHSVKEQDFDTHFYESFKYPKDIMKIKSKWVELGLDYEQTPWELNNLRQIAEEICKHPCNTIDVLEAIEAYSSEFKDTDSIYKFKHSITSFFGSKGAWKSFLRGAYIKGQYSKTKKNVMTDDDIKKRQEEIERYLIGD